MLKAKSLGDPDFANYPRVAPRCRDGGDENIPATGAVDDKGAEDAEPQQLTSRGGVGKYMRMGTAVWGIGSRISIPPCVLPLPLCSSCSANK
jgi:hypothetical protein